MARMLQSASAPWIIRLPASGRSVALRQPTGAEDMHLLESRTDDTSSALALAERLVSFLPSSPDSPAAPERGSDSDLRQLPASDLDALILRLRQALIGDRITAEITCHSPGCAKPIDISFGIDEYLDHHKPKPLSSRGSWRVEDAGETHWFKLTSSSVSKSRRATRAKVSSFTASEPVEVLFRLPTVADQLAIAGRDDGAAELTRRCLRPSSLPARLHSRVEAVMNAMAPCLSGDLQSICPECGRKIAVYFDARSFCLQELRNRAAFVFQDIDVLARRYHWSEADILALPDRRRSSYADFARQAEQISS